MARPELPAGVVVPGDDHPARRGARGRLGWIFAGIWLVYLVPTVQDAVHRPLLVERLVGTAGVAAFAVLYVLSFLASSRWRRQGRTMTPRRRVEFVAASALLFTVTAFAVGQSATAMLLFMAVQAIFVLPGRTGLFVALGCIVAEEALSRAVPGWEPQEGFALSIALACLAIWGVTGMIQRNLELQQAQATIAGMAVTAERTRFARDLHDILGHSLTVLTVKAELAGRLVTIDPGRAEREIGEVEALARQALADVRAAVAGYREVSLAGELASARAALESAGVAADLPGAVDDVPPLRRDLIAWAVREGVTNVVRHSGARHAWVRLTGDGVEIADDGRGPCDVDGDRPAADGHGLLGLRERAEAAGARVVVGRRDGGGFVLRVVW